MPQSNSRISTASAAGFLQLLVGAWVRTDERGLAASGFTLGLSLIAAGVVLLLVSGVWFAWNVRRTDRAVKEFVDALDKTEITPGVTMLRNSKGFFVLRIIEYGRVQMFRIPCLHLEGVKPTPFEDYGLIDTDTSILILFDRFKGWLWFDLKDFTGAVYQDRVELKAFRSAKELCDANEASLQGSFGISAIHVSLPNDYLLKKFNEANLQRPRMEPDLPLLLSLPVARAHDQQQVVTGSLQVELLEKLLPIGERLGAVFMKRKVFQPTIIVAAGTYGLRAMRLPFTQTTIESMTDFFKADTKGDGRRYLEKFLPPGTSGYGLFSPGTFADSRGLSFVQFIAIFDQSKESGALYVKRCGQTENEGPVSWDDPVFARTLR